LYRRPKVSLFGTTGNDHVLFSLSCRKTWSVPDKSAVNYVDPYGLSASAAFQICKHPLLCGAAAAAAAASSCGVVDADAAAKAAAGWYGPKLLSLAKALSLLNESSGGSGDKERPKKVPKPKTSGKDGSKDVPSWVKGERPYVGESGKDFADRVSNDKYGNGNFPKGPGSEHNKIRKYGDRGFQNPK